MQIKKEKKLKSMLDSSNNRNLEILNNNKNLSISNLNKNIQISSSNKGYFDKKMKRNKSLKSH